MSNHKRILITPGEIDKNVHYGPFAVYWWNFIDSKKSQNTRICFPIRINMRIKVELNEKEFIIRIVQNTKDSTKPGYICESDDDAAIYSTSSEVINENYRKFFDKTTRYSGPSVLGFDDETFTEQLQVGVLFFPFEIITNGITVFVASLGSSDEEELNFAGPDYCSSFNHKYSGKKSLICQYMTRGVKLIYIIKAKRFVLILEQHLLMFGKGYLFCKILMEKNYLVCMINLLYGQLKNI